LYFSATTEQLQLLQRCDCSKNSGKETKMKKIIVGQNFIRLLADGVIKNAQECNLEGADLQRANLREANLSESNLHGADLYGADLRGADLKNAGLQATTLCNCNLHGAIISYRGDKVRIKFEKI
jgi:uncharacterized protein YjbI with pentapeptide repeats